MNNNGGTGKPKFSFFTFTQRSDMRKKCRVNYLNKLSMQLYIVEFALRLLGDIQTITLFNKKLPLSKICILLHCYHCNHFKIKQSFVKRFKWFWVYRWVHTQTPIQVFNWAEGSPDNTLHNNKVKVKCETSNWLVMFHLIKKNMKLRN